MLWCSPAFTCLRGCRGSKGEDFISRMSLVATIFPSDFYQHLVQVPHFKEEGYCYFPTSESCYRAELMVGGLVSENVDYRKYPKSLVQF